MVRRDAFDSPSDSSVPRVFFVGGAVVVAAIVALPIFYWTVCRIDVPTGYMAVLTQKTGLELSNEDELAPSPRHKGLQKEVLAEGRHFRDPWNWDWEVVPQIEIPQGKIGVRVRLYGDDPPDSGIIAWQESEKGIVPQVLNPARYAINALVAGESRRRQNYAEIIELHDSVTVPAGFKGVVTNLSGSMPQDPNTIVLSQSDKGKRGVEPIALEAGTYPINPYLKRIDLVDCRSMRFNLSQDGDMGFPSKDGFWVTLDGIIEFRVQPDRAPEVLVMYNETANDRGAARGSMTKSSKRSCCPTPAHFVACGAAIIQGREFISGDTRTKFQEDFQKSLKTSCDSQGIEIIQALITKIIPPQPIAQPVRDRQIAVEKRKQFGRQLLQQESEKQLAIETELNQRKQGLVEAQKQVIQITTVAQQAQGIGLIEANKRLRVAELELQAAADQASATLARGTADAKVIQFQNEAEASGWRKAVAAFGGNGDEYARWTMLRKLAPAFRSMMVNTNDNPLMEIFRQYEQQPRPDAVKTTAGQ